MLDTGRARAQGDIDFKTAPWPSISAAAKDCVRQLLTMDPKKRPTAQQILDVRARAALLPWRLLVLHCGVAHQADVLPGCVTPAGSSRCSARASPSAASAPASCRDGRRWQAVRAPCAACAASRAAAVGRGGKAGAGL